jgi:hypothetical protein
VPLSLPWDPLKILNFQPLSVNEKRRGIREPCKIPGEHERFHALPHRRSWRLDGARRIERQGQDVHDRQSVNRSYHARTRPCREIKCSGAADDL